MNSPNEGLAKELAEKIQESTSLPEWKLWFLALLIGSTIMFIGYRLDLSEVCFTVVLFGVSAWAIYASFREAQTLDEELHAAADQVQRLVRCNDIGAFLSQSELKDSYFKDHLSSLYKIYFVSSQISQDNLIEILNSRLLAKNRKIELLSSILITIGLIGTIVGLVMMMTKLRLTVSDPSVGTGSNLLVSMVGTGGALEGLDTAFITTLLGAIFGGVMLRILTSVVEEGIIKYIANLAELTEIYVLPMLRTEAALLEDE